MYLVLDEFFSPTRPKVAFLLEQDRFPEDLLLLHEEKAPNDRKVRIFQIKEEDAAGPALPGD